MNIAYIVGSFPHVSETFIVNQIVGMAARGHVVNIYTTVPNVSRDVPAAVQRYRLLERTHSLYGPRNPLLRAVKAISLVASEGWRAPRLVGRALNILRYGRVAASLGLLCAGLTMRRQQRTGSYDVVHCQFGIYGEAALKLQEIGAFSGKLVTSFRGFDATKYLRSHPHAYDALFREGHLFLPVSQSLMECLIEAGCDRSKAVVLHSGIDCARFQYNERRHLKGEAMNILTIGRLTEKKGITYAIQAVAQVIASGRNLSYVIAGEGPLRAELQRLVDELSLSEHVHLLGWRTHDQVVDLIEAAHVLLAPSVTAADGDEEGIPNSVKEAMATGMPVVSTSHGGIPELVEDGVSGYLVPERDVEAIADRLRHLIDHPQTWAAMGKAARTRVLAEFDTEKLNDELERLYVALSKSQSEQNLMNSPPIFNGSVSDHVRH
jgi:colanic acid/amylovoran biosynthesis glycosyltransferase